ncbi:MAG: M42 family metallopeptidase [Verrucomicrobiota bacterium]
MDNEAISFLFDLLHQPSPTGFEAPGQRCWTTYVRKFADSVESDAYGTAWAELSGDGPRVMLAAHADEIGFIVKHITSEGFLRMDRIGGSDTATARGRRLQIFGDKGVVRGLVGNTAIHLRKGASDEKVPKIHELYVDIGASKPEEVAEMGIRVGHPAVYADGAERLGEHRIAGRALDNRIGGFIISQVMAQLHGSRPIANVIALNAVQEEIGGHGARMAAYRLQPEVCIVLDVTHATDTPGISADEHGEVELGEGPSLTHGACNHPEVVRRLMEVADKCGIPIQHESASRFTGTDADVIFEVRDGIPTALVSLPLRYMHSVIEMADLRDVQRVIDLLVGFVRSLQKGEQFRVQL